MRSLILALSCNSTHRIAHAFACRWEIAEIVKKLFLVGFVVLIQPGTTLQLVIGFTFCLVYLLFTSILNPFVGDDDDFFCTLCNFVLVAVLFLCVVLKQATLAEAVDTYLTPEMFELYYFDAGAVSVVLIGTILGAALVAVGYSVRQLAAAVLVPIIRLKATNRRPELLLDGTHRWHLFLSHIWSTGQDQNATMKRQLCLLLPGVAIFLDVDDLVDIGALERYIEESQAISLFCSKGYFLSRSCPGGTRRPGP